MDSNHLLLALNLSIFDSDAQKLHYALCMTGLDSGVDVNSFVSKFMFYKTYVNQVVQGGSIKCTYFYLHITTEF